MSLPTLPLLVEPPTTGPILRRAMYAPSRPDPLEFIDDRPRLDDSLGDSRTCDDALLGPEPVVAPPVRSPGRGWLVLLCGVGAGASGVGATAGLLGLGMRWWWALV